MLHPDQISFLYDSLGFKIKEEREKAKINQTHFANLLKISRASLVNIEKGRQRAPLHIIYEVARLLKIEIAFLLPSIQHFEKPEMNKKLMDKIDKKSAGNSEMQQKLMEFVNSHTILTKTKI